MPFAPIGSFLSFVLALAFVAAEAWILGHAVRRVLGVRVGWPRTVLVCLGMLVAIQAATEAILQYTGTDQDQPSGQALVAFLLIGGIAILWAFAIGALVLVVIEIVVPTGSLPRVRDLVFGWGERFRRAKRYRDVSWVFSKHGLRSLIWGRGWTSRPESQERLAASFRLALEECGVTFVKVGQMLSTRADLMPPVFVQELSKLQSTASPLPVAKLRPVLDEALGGRVLFSEFDDVPLASASTGQVHSAVMTDGTPVVVKVQRPEAARVVETDISIMERLARRLERNMPWAKRLGVVNLVAGFAASLREEMDYRVEADNMTAMRALLNPRGIRVPQAFVQERRVLVMERLPGAPIGHSGAVIESMSTEQREDAANRLLRSVFEGIVVDGIFHADLHPGNVFLGPAGEVGLIDFGAVGRLDAVSRRNLGLVLWAIDNDDPVLATDALLELVDVPEAGVDERALRRSIGLLITRFRGGFGSAGSGEVFNELLGLVVDHGLVIAPQLAAALRSLGALEGTLMLLDPKLDLVTAARDTGKVAAGDLTPEQVKSEFMKHAMRFLPLLENLPHRLDQLTADLEKGRFTVRTRVVSEPEDRTFLRGVVQLVVVSVLAAAAVLGGVILLGTPGGPMIYSGFSVYFMLGSLLSFAGFILALRAVAQVYWDSNRE